MRANEKKDFGKKPVRRSKSEENEPARVYRPRTAKFSIDRDKSKDEEMVEPEMVEEQDFQEPRPTKGFDKDTGYSRKGSRAESAENNNSDRKRRERTTSDESAGEKRKLERKSKTESGSSSSRVYEKKDGSRPFKRSADREKGDREYSHDKPSDYRSGRKKESYSSDSRKERKFEKPSGSGKIITRKGKSDDVKLSKGSKFSRKSPVIEADLQTDADGFIRLNKYIANSGLCSRREADEYIKGGMITVNGVTVDVLGTKVKLTDEIRFKGKGLDPERKVYIILNKPKDYITTVEDPNAKRTVMDLVEGACSQRVYPVGRLDRNSTGLLLLTNDGELTKQLTHPSFGKKKVYEVGLDKPLEQDDLRAMITGVELDGEMVKADAVEYIDENDKSNVGVEIHSGQNRVVRRIFDSLGYSVQKLDRVYFAGLTKKNLPRGKWRFLSKEEVAMLKMNRYE